MTEKNEKFDVWDKLAEAHGKPAGTIRPREAAKEPDMLGILQDAKNNAKANYALSLRPRVEDFIPPPKAWGVNVGPIPLPDESLYPGIPRTHVTGNLIDDLVVGIDPGTPGAMVVARRSGKNMIWLEQICDDKEGRALVQAILDRKKAQQ